MLDEINRAILARIYPRNKQVSRPSNLDTPQRSDRSRTDPLQIPLTEFDECTTQLDHYTWNKGAFLKSDWWLTLTVATVVEARCPVASNASRSNAFAAEFERSILLVYHSVLFFITRLIKL